MRMRARIIKVREETFNELRRIKERDGHTSFDSVIKSLLRNHREMEASRGR
jgi:predicted CopG family antitoxin